MHKILLLKFAFVFIFVGSVSAAGKEVFGVEIPEAVAGKIPGLDAGWWGWIGCKSNAEKVKFYEYTLKEKTWGLGNILSRALSGNIKKTEVTSEMVTNENGFNKDAKVVLLIHNRGSNIDAQGVTWLRGAYLQKANVRVIGVDWSAVAGAGRVSMEAFMNYVSGQISNYKLVGLLVGAFCLRMREAGVSLQNVHVIGTAFGAEVGSKAAYYIQQILEGTAADKVLGRITALNPEPKSVLANATNEGNWMDKNSAGFVVVVYTSRIEKDRDADAHVTFIVNPGTQSDFNLAAMSFAWSVNHGKEMIAGRWVIRPPTIKPNTTAEEDDAEPEAGESTATPASSSSTPPTAITVDVGITADRELYGENVRTSAKGTYAINIDPGSMKTSIPV